MGENARERERAVALRGSGAARQRADLYKGAFARITQAMAQGYHLEAITLIESLLGDRLESRISFLQNRNYAFKTLEKLEKQIASAETDPQLVELLPALSSWRGERNKALHEMAKLEDGDTRDWETRIAELAAIAERGIRLLRRFDRRLEALRVDR